MRRGLHQHPHTLNGIAIVGAPVCSCVIPLAPAASIMAQPRSGACQLTLLQASGARQL